MDLIAYMRNEVYTGKIKTAAEKKKPTNRQTPNPNA